MQNRLDNVDIMRGDKVLDTVGTGSILGEMALIDVQPRSATAIARTDCLLAPSPGCALLRCASEGQATPATG
jgi:hypothetical protein